MTNKEFFIKTIESEAPIFKRMMQAVSDDKAEWKPQEKARTAGDLAIQLAAQPSMMLAILKEGIIDFGKPYADEKQSISQAITWGDENWANLKKELAAISDEDWEKGEAKMVWPGGEWKTEKFDMAWGMLFDAIHHRGQLSTYVRVMGDKVPSIYGGSADVPA